MFGNSDPCFVGEDDSVEIVREDPVVSVSAKSSIAVVVA